MASILTSSTEQIVRLSSIDQSAARYYVRIALCYESNGTTIRNIIDRLSPAIKHTITRFPVLAGTVRSTTDGSNNQEGRLEVVTTLDNVKSFKAIMKSMVGLNFKSYEALCEASMPSLDLINGLLAPLLDIPSKETNPAFAVQVNQIDGGFVVALYLHHSVGDFATLSMIIEQLSGDLSPQELTPNDHEQYAIDQSTLRDVLTDPKGYKSQFADLVRSSHVRTNQTTRLMFQIDNNAPRNTSCLFSFDIKLLNEVESIVNARTSGIHQQTAIRAPQHASEIFKRPTLRVTQYAILTAILWKAITRARVNRGLMDINDNDLKLQSSTFFDYVNLRKTIDSPLDAVYVGNAQFEVFLTEPIYKLATPIDAASIARTARAITTANTPPFEGRVRSTIAAVNEATDVAKMDIKGMLLSSDLAIMNWTDLDLKNATLNLGLGEPGWARQISTSVDDFIGCIVHTKREEEGLWDVMVQVPVQTMHRLREDVAFMAFVKDYA